MLTAALDHLWQSTLVALLIGALILAFRRASASVRYALWLSASVKFLIPFAALAALGRLLAPAGFALARSAPEAAFIQKAARPFSDFAVSHGTASQQALSPLASFPFARAAGTEVPLSAAALHAAPPVALPHLDLTWVVLAVWALGFAALATAWALRWARLRKVVGSATPVAWPAPMPVLAAPSLVEPGLVGLWRPVLLLPESLPEHLNPVEIAAIVAHEACHLRRKDNLSAALHMLVEALFWFHPMVWWIGGRMIAERERACDEAVVGAGHDRATYARSLIESCKLYLQSPLDCVAGASGSNLKSRVETIMTAPLTSPLSLSKKALLAAAAAFAFATPVAAGMLATPAGQQVAARATAIASGLTEGRAAPVRETDELSPTAPVALSREKSILARVFAVAGIDLPKAALTQDFAAPRIETPTSAAEPAPIQLAAAAPTAPQAAASANPKLEAESFVQAYAAMTDRRVLARWRGPICVRVVGLTSEQAAAVKARVEEVAKGVGLSAMRPAAQSSSAVVTGSRVTRPPYGVFDDAGCPGFNIEIGFATDPQAMLDAIVKRSGQALGDPTSATRDVKTVTRPVQAWYMTNGLQAARYEGRGARNGLKVDVVWQSAIPDGGGSFGSGPGAGYMAPGSQAGGGAGWGPGLMAPPSYDDLHRALRNVFVIVDLKRAGDKNLGLMADYVSMLALSEPRQERDACAPLPSITDLFLSCPGRAAPDGLTAADAAYLTALYGAPTTAESVVAGRMAKILDKAKAQANAAPAQPIKPAAFAGAQRMPQASLTLAASVQPADARQAAESFVKTYAAQVGSRQVTGRWRSPICVEVVGLTPEQDESVKARVEAVAARAGIAVAAAPERITGSRIGAGSGKGCQVYNVEIGFTENPQDMLDKVAARKTHALGDGTSATRNAKTMTLPIQAWYLTNSAMVQNDTGGLKAQVVWQRGDPNAGGGSVGGEGYVGGAYIPPGSSSSGLGGGSNFGSSDFGFPRGSAWNSGPDLHRGFANVFVIVDLRRAGTKNLGLIADYVSMLALSEPAALGNCQALPSVTDLFASCPGRPAPDGLTTADAAYLTALYDKDRAAGTDDVARRMADILDKAKLASR